MSVKAVVQIAAFEISINDLFDIGLPESSLSRVRSTHNHKHHEGNFHKATSSSSKNFFNAGTQSGASKYKYG
jgi:lipopolysaccharide biosynthesis glycosyltransferase